MPGREARFDYALQVLTKEYFDLERQAAARAWLRVVVAVVDDVAGPRRILMGAVHDSTGVRDDFRKRLIREAA